MNAACIISWGHNKGTQKRVFKRQVFLYSTESVETCYLILNKSSMGKVYEQWKKKAE